MAPSMTGRHNMSSGHIRHRPQLRVPHANKSIQANDSADIEAIERLLDEAISRFGQQARLIRKQKRITQADIAARTGLAQSMVSRIENGERECSVRALLKLDIGLRVPAGILMAMFDFGDVDSRPTVITSRLASRDSAERLAHEIGEGVAVPRQTRKHARHRRT